MNKCDWLHASFTSHSSVTLTPLHTSHPTLRFFAQLPSHTSRLPHPNSRLTPYCGRIGSMQASLHILQLLSRHYIPHIRHFDSSHNSHLTLRAFAPPTSQLTTHTILRANRSDTLDDTLDREGTCRENLTPQTLFPSQHLS